MLQQLALILEKQVKVSRLGRKLNMRCWPNTLIQFPQMIANYNNIVAYQWHQMTSFIGGSGRLRRFQGCHH
jgi:hypothetical protein